MIPIIDIFAGPGGLGEGFASHTDSEDQRAFRLALSIEKESIACATLRMRALRRSLANADELISFHAMLRGEFDRAAFEAIPLVAEARAHALSEVLHAELGQIDSAVIDQRIRRAIGGANDWVLIGGPPCQAYSLAGRARRVNDASFEADEKHFLYREYLRIIRAHAPPVFVMENVKGLLSSHHGGSPMFSRIYEDLSEPGSGLSYEIRSFVKDGGASGLHPQDFIIESERFGIPQCRHRVILLGVRSDLAFRKSGLLSRAPRPATVGGAISSMPVIRSKLSRGDSAGLWHDAIASASKAVQQWRGAVPRKVIAAMKTAAVSARNIETTGAPFLKKRSPLAGAPKVLGEWLEAPGLGGVIQHEARGHMASDLARYLFASSFAQVVERPPKLADFPAALLPDHVNASEAKLSDAPFTDRFRVQRAEDPASTVVSHIAKDGHYYIHYDGAQCRSLTVREAARLQTFPEDYFFEGTRTQQYVQVGNAVPPLLARQLARVVFDLLESEQSWTSSARHSRIQAEIA